MSPEKELAQEVAQLLLAARRADVARQPDHVFQRVSCGRSTSSSCCAK
jgi:hypothetical protein